MKCLVYAGPDDMRLEDRPMPEPALGEVLLRIDAVGICGSDMHCFHGHDPRRKPGLVLGHEFAGTVVESKAETYMPGQRFTGNPLITCGRCVYCVQGRNNLCADRSMIGMTRPGAYAEFMTTPAHTLINLPNGMSQDQAALTEPAATALHAVNASMKMLTRPLSEQRVLVIGGGAIGFLSALLLQHYGCYQILVAETNAKRLEMIRQYIGVDICNPVEESIPEDAFGCVIDAVGSTATRTAAMQAVCPGGVMVHVGLQDWASEIDMRKLTLAEITLMGVYTYSTADLQAATALLHQGAFGDLSWVQTMPLSQGVEAFHALDKGLIAASKILLIPEEAA